VGEGTREGVREAAGAGGSGGGSLGEGGAGRMAGGRVAIVVRKGPAFLSGDTGCGCARMGPPLGWGGDLSVVRHGIR